MLDPDELKTKKGKEQSYIIEEVPLTSGKYWKQVKDDFADSFLKMKQEFDIKK
jgi:hypothetical protein